MCSIQMLTCHVSVLAENDGKRAIFFFGDFNFRVPLKHAVNVRCNGSVTCFITDHHQVFCKNASPQTVRHRDVEEAEVDDAVETPPSRLIYRGRGLSEVCCFDCTRAVSRESDLSRPFL